MNNIPRDPSEELFPLPFPPWGHINTENWLTEHKLPVDFCWPDDHGVNRPVLNKHKLSKGYGYWLRTTPYFPHLFEDIHEILARCPLDQLQSQEYVVDELNKRRKQGTQGELL